MTVMDDTLRQESLVISARNYLQDRGVPADELGKESAVSLCRDLVRVSLRSLLLARQLGFHQRFWYWIHNDARATQSYLDRVPPQFAVESACRSSGITPNGRSRQVQAPSWDNDHYLTLCGNHDAPDDNGHSIDILETPDRVTDQKLILLPKTFRDNDILWRVWVGQCPDCGSVTWAARRRLTTGSVPR